MLREEIAKVNNLIEEYSKVKDIVVQRQLTDMPLDPESKSVLMSFMVNTYDAMGPLIDHIQTLRSIIRQSQDYLQDTDWGPIEEEWYINAEQIKSC